MPKGFLLIPKYCKLVDNLARYQLISFMDAYLGYNQIPMYGSDRIKTTFLTKHSNYQYNVTPFGLKNSNATYQGMMNKIFQEDIWGALYVYMDDMIEK